jgi:hypothetical protein
MKMSWKMVFLIKCCLANVGVGFVLRDYRGLEEEMEGNYDERLTNELFIESHLKFKN